MAKTIAKKMTQNNRKGKNNSKKEHKIKSVSIPLNYQIFRKNNSPQKYGY